MITLIIFQLIGITLDKSQKNRSLVGTVIHLVVTETKFIHLGDVSCYEKKNKFENWRIKLWSIIQLIIPHKFWGRRGLISCQEKIIMPQSMQTPWFHLGGSFKMAIFQMNLFALILIFLNGKRRTRAESELNSLEREKKMIISQDGHPKPIIYI